MFSWRRRRGFRRCRFLQRMFHPDSSLHLVAKQHRWVCRTPPPSFWHSDILTFQSSCLSRLRHSCIPSVILSDYFSLRDFVLPWVSRENLLFTFYRIQLSIHWFGGNQLNPSYSGLHRESRFVRLFELHHFLFAPTHFLFSFIVNLMWLAICKRVNKYAISWGSEVPSRFCHRRHLLWGTMRWFSKRRRRHNGPHPLYTVSCLFSCISTVNRLVAPSPNQFWGPPSADLCLRYSPFLSRSRSQQRHIGAWARIAPHAHMFRTSKEHKERKVLTVTTVADQGHGLFS